MSNVTKNLRRKSPPLQQAGSEAIWGECTFYHGGKKGRPIPIKVRDVAHRKELLQKLCDDPEVEGFDIAWSKPLNDRLEAQPPTAMPRKETDV